MRILRFLLVFCLVAVVLVGGLLWYRLVPGPDPRPLPPGLVSAEASEGQALLGEADATADYDDLRAHFETQQLTSFCGVASGVTVLGALGRDVTQLGYFDRKAAKVRPFWRVALTGMTLDAAAGLIAAHGAKAQKHHADGFDAGAFRETVRRNLATEGDYLIVNYQRAALGQESTGHISPLAAYDEETDMVLILDTASYKYPPTWAPLAELYAAMATTDSESGKKRGYIEVSGGG